jgi:hypothetical protein
MPDEPFQPQNDLEVALLAAAADTAARPRFYRALLESNVLIVPVGQQPSVLGGVVQGESPIALKAIEIEGRTHTPFFSSENRLLPGTPYLGLKARDFLHMTKGAHLVLNPGSDYGKLFVPAEVERLLDGSLLVAKEKDYFKASAGSKRIIGQPKDYPHSFAAALARYFASEPSVDRAYLAQHFISDVHTEPALLIAIVTSTDEFDRIAAATGLIARETKKTQNAVDVVRLDNSKPDNYFTKQKPIYERKGRGFLQRILG